MTTQQSPESDVAGPDTPVWKLMVRAVARISPEARLDELARKLSAIEAGAMAVGTTDQLAGIVSERDLTRAHGRDGDVAALRVGDIASTDLIWCAPDDTAAAAARTMVDRGVRHLLVGDGGGELQGIVSARDLIEALSRA